MNTIVTQNPFLGEFRDDPQRLQELLQANRRALNSILEDEEEKIDDPEVDKSESDLSIDFADIINLQVH